MVRDYLGYTPLHLSSEVGKTDVMEQILSAGVGVEILNSTGLTPLFVATLGGHAQAVRLLLDAGSDPNKLDANGSNALFGAVNLQVVKVLVEAGASAKIVNSDGGTALHQAAYRKCDAATICALFKAGCDPTVLDQWDKSAADWAREKGHEDAAKLLDLLAAKQRALNSHTSSS